MMKRKFGELRALMHKPFWTKIERDQLWILTSGNYHKNSTEYNNTWLDYIWMHPNLKHFDDSFMKISTLVELELASKILPMAKWSFEIEGVLIGKETTLKLSKTPCFSSIKHLTLRCGDIGYDEISLLRNSKYFPQLESLNLPENIINNKGLEVISTVPSLNFLDLSNNEFNDDGLAFITSSDNMSQLQVLNINYNSELTSRSAMLISHSEYLNNIKSLGMSDLKIGDAGLIELSESTNMSSLESLNLSWSGVEEAGVYALSNSIYMSNLIDLNLWCNKIRDEGVIFISESTFIKNIKSLNLYGTRLSSYGVANLVHSSNFEFLKTLNLGSNDIGNEGVGLICRSPYLNSLSYLDVSRVGMDDEGALSIAKSPNFQYLQYLDLRDNHLGPEVLTAIENSDQMPSLDSLVWFITEY